MLGQLQLKGGIRLDANGRFEVYLNASGGSKAQCTSSSWTQYLRELFDFLLSRDNERQIGDRVIFKTRSSAGNSMVIMSTEGFDIRLIRGQGEFATFILELPFMGNVEVQEDQVGVGSRELNESEGEEWDAP